ncbi:hypothetical protein ACIQWB_35255 [Streptomyces olivaceus]|uniref:hypothetical protein n=1 Tax=Streptomyces olivaceus TaxID=47716 RepID=UPI0038009BB2
MTAVFDPAVIAAQLTENLDKRARCGRHPEQILPCQHMTCRSAAEPDPDPERVDDATDDVHDEVETELARRITELSIPEHLWEQPHLKWVKQEADAINVKPEGLLLKVGNRAACIAGPRVVGHIDARGNFPLTGITATVGRSSAGSGTSDSAVNRLLPVPAELKQPPTAVDYASQVGMVDLGYLSLNPSSGSALLDRMQKRLPVLQKDSENAETDTVTAFVPRVELNYGEGSTLLNTLEKSKGSGNSGAGLENIVLDAYFGAELKYDTTGEKSRTAIPAGSYAMAVNSYFQVEFIGQALSHTHGLVQRMPIVPIVKPAGDAEVAKAGLRVANGEGFTAEEAEAQLAGVPDRPDSPGEMPGVIDFLTQRNGAPDTPYKRMTMCRLMALNLRLIEAERSGVADLDPLKGHAGQVQYRIAAWMALLRCSYHINEDDWEVAQAFARVSSQAVELCRDWAAAENRKADSEDNTKTARRARVSEEARTLARGETPRIVKMIGRRMREKLKAKGDLSASDLSDRISAADGKAWGEIGGEGGRSGLRNAALEWGLQQGYFARAGRRYSVRLD